MSNELTAEDLLQRLRAGGGRLMFDTNAIWGGPGWLMQSCDTLNRWNVRLRKLGREPMVLSLSALVYAEKVFDLIQDNHVTKRFKKFDAKQVRGLLMGKGLEIAPFDIDAAEATAHQLGDRFPSDEEWQDAKQAHHLLQLGLTKEKVSKNRRCSATVDWFVAGHATALDAIVVCKDGGPEWHGVNRCTKTTMNAALTVLIKEV